MSILNPERPLTDDEKEFIDYLLPKLPPVVARKEVGRVLGGIVAHQTLNMADCAGSGPTIAYRVGRSVVYRTESLLGWLVLRFGVSRIANLKTL